MSKKKAKPKPAPKPSSGTTIPSAERAARGQVQLALRLTAEERTALLAMVDRRATDGESRGQTILRLLQSLKNKAG